MWMDKLFSRRTGGFVPRTLTFSSGLEVETTALLDEGDSWRVFKCAQVAGGSSRYAVRQLVQGGAMEAWLFETLSGGVGARRCHGTMQRPGEAGESEHWVLLEECPNGSLADLIFGGAPLTPGRALGIFEEVCAAVAQMHALHPPVAHRGLTLESVLCTTDGRYVIGDLGSAVRHVLPAGGAQLAAVHDARSSLAESASTTKYDGAWHHRSLHPAKTYVVRLCSSYQT